MIKDSMKLIFRDKNLEAQEIFTFYFSSKEDITWVAGQTVGLELETDYLSEERHFTISSAPFEKIISITTRVSESGFKQALSQLKPGDQVEAFAVGGGDFIWEGKPSVFVAGGIGITPYFSILKQLSHEGGSEVDIHLIYSARRQSEIFKKEIATFQKQFKKLRVQPVYEQRISAEMIAGAVPDLKKRLVYISGPSGLVDDISQGLKEDYQVDENSLKLDWFTGL